MSVTSPYGNPRQARIVLLAREQGRVDVAGTPEIDAAAAGATSSTRWPAQPSSST